MVTIEYIGPILPGGEVERDAKGNIKNYITVGELKKFLENLPSSWRVNIDINSENDWCTLSVVWWGDEPKEQPALDKPYPSERRYSVTIGFPTSHCQRCRKVEIPGSWGYCDGCSAENEREQEREKEALRIGMEVLEKRGK